MPSKVEYHVRRLSKICLFVLTESANATDTRTDTQTHGHRMTAKGALDASSIAWQKRRGQPSPPVRNCLEPLLTSSFSECTPLERCCVHMSPFVSSSGLSPGSREAEVQRAKVCLNCTEPSVVRSSCWSLPVGRYLSDTHCKGSTVVLAR